MARLTRKQKLVRRVERQYIVLEKIRIHCGNEQHKISTLKVFSEMIQRAYQQRLDDAEQPEKVTGP